MDLPLILLFVIVAAILIVAAIHLAIGSFPDGPDIYTECDEWLDCFREGREAHEAGLDVTENPHPSNSKRHGAWRDGFVASANRAVASNKEAA